MPFLTQISPICLIVAALVQAPAASAQTTELDALSLESAPVVTPKAASDTKFFVEGAVGTATQRYVSGNRDLGRFSLDFSHTARLAPGLRATMSNRLDYFDPKDAGTDAAINSLREAYVTWQPEAGRTVVEFGRINLRYGPGYGYNPTDFFRDGSVRALTSANPFALRENRLGSVMLRAQRLWVGGSLSIAYSPKLADEPSADGWSLDLGSTNNRDRALIALGTQFSQSVSAQILVYKEAGLSPTLGASLNALVSDAATAHLEWSNGSEPDLLSRVLAQPSATTTRNRFVGGLSYTTASKLSITAEYQYNGFALAQADWATLGAASAPRQVAHLIEAQRRQELVPREAYLLYLTQKSLGLKNLDLTAFLKVNAGDQSQLVWAELRHHWPKFDLAFQIQQHIGNPTSEFGILPDRTVMQVLGTYFF